MPPPPWSNLRLGAAEDVHFSFVARAAGKFNPKSLPLFNWPQPLIETRAYIIDEKRALDAICNGISVFLLTDWYSHLRPDGNMQLSSSLLHQAARLMDI